MQRTIEFSITIPAPISEVWKAWTTEEGARGFFAPECRIDLQPGGAYEMYFDHDAPVGERGGEGLVVLAVQAPTMLSFTWNAPPSLPDVRGQHTHVTVRLEEIDSGTTLVRLFHDGWGVGGQWDQAFDYFTRAWGKVVLPRLEHYFKAGPINWEDPPALGRRDH